MRFAGSLARSLTAKRPRRLRALVAVAVPVAALVGPLAGNAAAESLSVTPAQPLAQGPLSPAQQHLLQQGYLVPNQAAYDAAKARAARQAPRSAAARAAAFTPRVPTANPSFAGERDTNLGPPDTTGAVGTT